MESTPNSPSTSPTTTSPQPAGASADSTIGKLSQPPQPARFPVRERPISTPYTSYQLTERTQVRTALGRTLVGQPGEWVIAQGTFAIEVLPDADYLKKYVRADANAVTVSGGQLTQIARALGIGSVNSPEALVGAVERLARLKIGEVTIPLTPGQWETLRHRAAKRGLSVPALVQQIVDKITQDLFQV